MKVVIGLYILALTLVSPLANAREGGWSGGGGEVIGDQHNPWFLENTPIVTFCVDVEQSSISARQETISPLIERVIQQWTRLFTPYNGKSGVKLATQKWLRLSCGGDVDVRFQFGWGTLSEKQKQFLESSNDPHRYIAIAVRTDYDLVHLKAKGFVYIASDIGPHSFQREATQIERPWRFPMLLFVELTHELGHVFGLPHLNSELLSSSHRGVMSEYYPDLILQQWVWTGSESGLLLEPSDLKTFFNLTEFNDCSPTPDALNWFHAPSGTKCLRFAVKNLLEGPAELLVSLRDQSNQVKELGQINFGSIGHQEIKSDITVYLNSKQSVLPAPALKSIPYVFGPGVTNIESSGQFISVSGEMKSAFIVLGENRLEIIVQLKRDGQNEELLPIVSTTESDEQ